MYVRCIFQITSKCGKLSRNLWLFVARCRLRVQNYLHRKFVVKGYMGIECELGRGSISCSRGVMPQNLPKSSPNSSVLRYIVCSSGVYSWKLEFLTEEFDYTFLIRMYFSVLFLMKCMCGLHSVGRMWYYFWVSQVYYVVCLKFSYYPMK